MATAEIIPSNPLPLPGFETALTRMDELEAKMAPIATRARVLEVNDAASYGEAGQLIALLKNITKDSEATMQPFKLIVQRVKDFMQTRFNKNKNYADSIHAVLSSKMGEWVRKESAAAEAEEKKLNKRSAVPVTVQPNIPKVAGVRNTTNYFVEVTDRSKFINAFLKGDKERRMFLGQFLAIDEKELAAYAREEKDPEKVMKEIPGVLCRKVEAFGGKV